jgi:hypothetical protein
MAEAYESDECIITTTNFNIVGRASESQFSRDKPLKHPFMRAFDHLTHSHAVGIKRSISGEEYIGTGINHFWNF